MGGEWLPICPKCYNTRINDLPGGNTQTCDYCKGRGFVEHTVAGIEAFRPEEWHGAALEAYQLYSDGFLLTGISMGDQPALAVLCARHLKSIVGVNQMLEQKQLKERAAKASKR